MTCDVPNPSAILHNVHRRALYPEIPLFLILTILSYFVNQTELMKQVSQTPYNPGEHLVMFERESYSFKVNSFKSD